MIKYAEKYFFGGKNGMFEPEETFCVEDAVKKVLNSSDYLNREFVSLFEVFTIYQKVKQEWQRVKKEMETTIVQNLKSIDSNYYAELHEFDNEENQVSLSVYRALEPKEIKFYFKKYEIIIEPSNLEGELKDEAIDILSLVDTEIIAWWKYCYLLKEAEEQHSYGVKSVNSSFYANIDLACMNVYYDIKQFVTDFNVLSLYEANNNVYLKSKSDDIMELLKDNELDFIKKVFVKIADCPQWMQEQLRTIREEQFEQIAKQQEEAEQERAEKERAEQERIKKEEAEKEQAKKQKKCGFLKKIFFFVK